MRTIIDLPKESLLPLDELAKTEKTSRAALIREAVSEFLQRKGTVGEERAFGIWKAKGEDGVAFQERLRKEWEE